MEDLELQSSPQRAIGEYASRFHAALGAEHGAASPLGAWLLLALVAPAARGTARQELERALGCSADRAAAFARSLLESPHPAVRLALAAWNDRELLGPGLAPWLDALPRAVEKGAIPSQATADTWARATTAGKLEKFPLTIHERAVVILASALTADGEWKSWFDLAPATDLGTSPWAAQVQNVLCDHVQSAGTFLRTEPAGVVAAQVKVAKEGFLVASVIAAPDVAHADVMAAAYDVAAAAVESRSDRVKVVSQFDLPLGEGHSWTITEEKFKTTDPDVRLQSARIVLPAWHVPARTINLIGDAAFGLGAAARALMGELPRIPEGYGATAAQATTARFDRPGFSAASITALHIHCGAKRMLGDHQRTFLGRRRFAEVRFHRPYAVVAIAAADPQSPWNGLPFVSAWVTQPTEPDARSRDF